MSVIPSAVEAEAGRAESQCHPQLGSRLLSWLAWATCDPIEVIAAHISKHKTKSVVVWVSDYAWSASHLCTPYYTISLTLKRRLPFNTHLLSWLPYPTPEQPPAHSVDFPFWGGQTVWSFMTSFTNSPNRQLLPMWCLTIPGTQKTFWFNL